MNNKRINCAMTIAGSDSGAGAGIQADILTFASHNVYATSVITTITAQNPDGVSALMPMTKQLIDEQINQVYTFYKPNAVKTGMLFNAQIIESVAEFFKNKPQIPLVVDPVMISTSGAKLLEDEAIEAMAESLVPISTIFTPNLDEAKVLLKCKDIKKTDMLNVAKDLAEKFKTNVLLKGGHLKSDKLIDVLVLKNEEVQIFENDRVMDIDTHGSGCTLSAAIAANLAKAKSVKDACKNANLYLNKCIKKSLNIGDRNFINHFANKS